MIMVFTQVQKPFRWICILILYTCTHEIVSKYAAMHIAKSNSVISHFTVLPEFIIYLIIYGYFFQQKKWNQRLFALGIVFIIFQCINTYFFQPLSVTNTNALLLQAILLVFLSLMLFVSIRENMGYINLFAQGIFWFNTIVLVYYSFSILIWGFHSIKVYLLSRPPKIVYTSLLAFSALLYITFVVSIILNYFSYRASNKSA